ncbi:GNAT family N-acetyltransferase [Halobium palmae]|uniref:GNAT family N-acetyltransferase n=1 Tax=Halobium palmae TaxID=1776492 RepID=A0ABD5S180_9EURY
MPGETFLRTDRLTLRTVERDDVDFLQRGHNDPDVRTPLGMYGPKNGAQVEGFVQGSVEDDDSIDLLVCVDDDPVGAATVNNLHWDRPALGYWLVPEARGNGYATEAVGALVDHLFETYDRHGVHARVFDFNEASRALLDRLGFAEEGRLRENRFRRGEYVDELTYGLLRREWEEARPLAER